MPAFDEMIDCLEIAAFAIENIEVKTDVMQEERYKLAFSVEEVNKLVLSGVPFRDAYKQVGLAIEAGQFETDGHVNHCHEGSIGNLCNENIEKKKDKIIQEFGFEEVNRAIQSLLATD
jgi:argininosuccinate lyase